MKKDIRQIERKIQRSSYEDGLNEVAFGLITLLLAGYFFLQATIPAETLLYRILSYGFVLILVGGGLLAFRISGALKERLTYPRSGYVTFPQPKRVKLLLTGLIAMLLAAMLVVIMKTATSTSVTMPSLSAFVIATAFFTVGVRLNLLRYYLISLFSLLIGGVLAYFGPNNLLGLSYFYTLLAFSLLVIGILTLIRFLRLTQHTTD